MSFRVFISHASQDQDAVQQIRSALDAVGVEAYVAVYHLPPGSELVGGIVEALRSADLVVLVWSSFAGMGKPSPDGNHESD